MIWSLSNSASTACADAIRNRSERDPQLFELVHQLELENGRISEEVGLDDGVTALRQLGLIRPA